MKQPVIDRFRIIAIAEGISFLLLLCIGMPLKYYAAQPLPLKYMGWLHGVLFILYVLFLLQVWAKYNWSFGKVFMAFIASLLPFGAFILERKLKKEEQAMQ